MSLPTPTRTATAEYELVATTDADTLARREACAADSHPHGCYNPWLDQTFCQCGARRWQGDQVPAKPPIPLCRSFKAMTMQPYCGSCYHDRDEHADVQPVSVEAQFALFPAA